MAECLPVKEKVARSSRASGAMENVDYYDIRRDGNNIVITFFDIVEEAEEFIFPIEDAWAIMRSLWKVISGT